jgi:signal transduction histidine kinase
VGAPPPSAPSGSAPGLLGFLGGSVNRWIGANLVTALLYSTLGYAVGRFFAQYGLFPSPIWLPSSIAVVAAMIGGMRLFPGIFLGSFIANYVLLHPPLDEAVLISVTNAVGPIVGAAATRRLRPEAGLFNRFSGVVVFIVCNILLHPALTATGGTIAQALGRPLDVGALSAIWVRWWLSDSGGTLYLAPALLLWLGVEKESTPQRRDVDLRDLAVWAGVAAVVVVLFATVPLQGSIRWAFPFLLVLPLSWIALRMSLRAAYSLIFFVSIVASAGTVAGHGPFQGEGISNPLQFVGVLIVLLALNVLTIVALIAERRAAEESSRFKSMFLASASHDLRTPLNAIIGFSDMIRSEVLGPVGNPRYREYVEHIHDSGRLLLSITDDILDLSKIEAGRREIAPTLLDGRAIAEACLNVVAIEARAKGIALGVEAEDSVRIYADNLALRQILLNLLSNAIAFTPAGGRVTVRIAGDSGGSAVIDIVDTGIGMTAEEIEVALQPFGQIDKTSPARGRGTGLGLPISVRLTELHGGGLTIASTPGQGTTIRATFPPPTAPEPSLWPRADGRAGYDDRVKEPGDRL